MPKLLIKLEQNAPISKGIPDLSTLRPPAINRNLASAANFSLWDNFHFTNLTSHSGCSLPTPTNTNTTATILNL